MLLICFIFLPSMSIRTSLELIFLGFVYYLRHMRWMVCFFSLYVLILSCIPCDADNDCCIDEITTASSSPNNSPDDQHKPACPCSPFFACSTCHIVLVPSYEITLFKASAPVSKLDFFYRENDLRDFPPAIWQPPRKA